jgi:NADPH:quinone reductase-like Zn-dependent oxidoreductase
MRAFEVRGRFGLDALVPVERPDPVPAPGRVVIRLRARSLNYRDLLMVRGLYNPKLKLPLVPLSDGVGEVVAVGEGVRRVAAGDRVCPILFPRWLDGPPDREKLQDALGGPLDGTLAEAMAVPEEAVVRVPEHLTDVEAAALPCAGVTAWCALAEGGLRAGEVLLVQGTGGVALFALQFGTMMGARVIVTSSSDAKLERARALGAAHGVNYRTTPDWERAVRDLTGGRGVDHVLELGGAGTFPRSARAVRVGGRISVIGVLAGSAGEIDLTPVLMRALQVQGVIVGSRASFEAMNAAIAAHGLRPVVDEVFAFDEALPAFERLAGQGHFGKLALRGPG